MFLYTENDTESDKRIKDNNERFLFVILCDLLPPLIPIPGVSQSSLLGEKYIYFFF